MTTSSETIESLRGAFALVPEVSFQPTMGDYSVYSRGRLFAVVCDGELYIKATPETLCLFKDPVQRSFPGSIDACRADDDWLLDPEKLGEVALYTLASHPPPRPARPARVDKADESHHIWRPTPVKALILLSLLPLLYLALPYGALRAIGIHKGARAADFSVTGLNGEKAGLAACAGRPVFLYVWESNSQRAIDNLPMIGALYEDYRRSRVCFLAVTITADFNGTVRSFAAAKALKYPVYNGAGALPAQFMPDISPMLYLIDHEGYVRYAYSPSSLDREKIYSHIEVLLRDLGKRRQEPFEQARRFCFGRIKT